MIRKFLPKKLKLNYQLAKRYVKYQFLHRLDFAASKGEFLKSQFSIALPIRKTASYNNKVANLKLASERLNGLIISPNQVFAFWKIIGAPTQKNGYKKGRNIVNNQLVEDYGGGLCQLSGLIYYLAIKADLEILERHNHSKDIYDDDSRFTPLGTDATVVYGYRDLMIRNDKDFSIQLDVQITGAEIVGALRSDMEIKPRDFIFDIQERTDTKIVVITDKIGREINQSVYKK